MASSTDSPAVARRRVRLVLREAREAKGLTQGQVAEAMEWSLSKIMRIETGEVTISPNDLRPLLAYLGITDRTRVDRLIQDAKLSKSRQQWWDQPRFREHLTPAMRQLIQFEVEATAIRYFSATVFPGPLQTAAYAKAVLSKWRGELPEQDVEVRSEARLRRRNQLLSKVNSPQIFVLLDESLLLREVGGHRVIGEQLADLLGLTKDKAVIVRVMPFTMDVPISNVASYDLLYLGDDSDEDNAIMYRETHTIDEIVEDRGKVRRHRDIFDQSWEAALDEAMSARLIEQRITTLSSSENEAPGG